MAKFGLDKAEFYGGQGGGGFLSFKHRETARIRLLYNSVSDVEGYAVHNVELGGKKRYVDCLCGADGDKSKCPLCMAGFFTEVRYFVPVFDEDTGAVLTWDRGRTYGKILRNLFRDYAAEKPLTSTCFRVTREINVQGFPFYSITPEFTDDTTASDLPDYNANVYGKLVLVKTAEEMQNYLDYGDFYGEEAV